jgi:peptidoglycan/xylan/chitin deacetylase (PgdA/CDA1 family)
MSRLVRAALLALLCVLVIPAVAAAQTVVSLEFDDGVADQSQTDPLLAAHGMHATFFVPSGYVGQSGYMNWTQIKQLASDGNEIGGHTVSHPHLATLSVSEQQREICNDRVNLLNQGFAVTDFAYPFGSYDADSEQALQQCGYNSGRSGTGISVPGACSSGCTYTETTPPPDPYATRTPEDFKAGTPLSAIEAYVTQAEQNGGGWVQLVFHHVCDNACDQYSISPSDFSSLLDWLQPRAASGTVVQTVAQVIGGPVKPGIPGPAAPPPSALNLVNNSSLETSTATAGSPDCFQLGGYGTNTRAWSWSDDAHTGLKAAQLTVSGYSGGDAKVLTKLDLGTCSPSLTPGTRYAISAWYKSTAPTQFVMYARNPLGSYDYWSTSSQFPATSTWTQATWVTPPLPANDTGAGFGLSLMTNGTLTTDDYSMVAQQAPSPGDQLLQNGSMEMTAASGVPICWQTINSGGTNTANWQQTSDAHSSAYAEQVQISSLTSGDQELVTREDEGSCAPSVSAGQQYAESGWYKSDQPIRFVAYYHVPGSGWFFLGQSNSLPASPTYVQSRWTTPAIPSGADLISVGARLQSIGTMQLDDFSLILADTSPPTVALTSPTQSTINGSVALTANASDDRGVDHVDFLIDGNVIATASSAPYIANWNSSSVADGAHTLTARSYDTSGNSTDDAHSITIDNTSPSSSASSAAVSPSTTFPVQYSASDATSRLARVDLYALTPGASGFSKVATATGSATTGSFDYTASAGDGHYRFYTVATDAVGNVQATPTTAQSDTLVDTQAPSATGSSPAITKVKGWTVSYTASDPAGGSGLASVELWVQTPAAKSYVKIAAKAGTSTNGSFTYTPSGDGTYRFQLIGVDGAGNRESLGTQPDTSTLLDTVAPGAFRITAPPMRIRGYYAFTLASLPADTGSGIAQVVYQYRRPNSRTWVTACTAAGSPWTCVWNTRTVFNSGYYMQSIATDRAGNSTTSWNEPVTQVSN